MKKAVVLGMILLAIGGMAFADGATVGFGFGRTTFTLAAGSSANSDIWSGFGTVSGNTWPPAPRENLSLAYDSDHAAFHFQAYLDGTALSWPGIYGTLKLIPDMFSVIIGNTSDDGWDDFRKTSPHPLRDTNNGNVGRFSGYGIIAVVMPKDSGFEAAVQYAVGDPTGTVNGNVDLIGNQANNINFAASYTLPSLLKATLGSTTSQQLVGNPRRNIFGRVELLLVPNLTLWTDVKYEGLDVNPSQTNISAFLAAGYDMKPLMIALAGSFTSFSVGSVTTWGVIPEVYYDMGMLTLGLYLNVNGTSVSGSGINYQVEPYVKLNDFNLRASFMYSGNTQSGSTSTWEIPLVIGWGF